MEQDEDRGPKATARICVEILKIIEKEMVRFEKDKVVGECAMGAGLTLSLVAYCKGVQRDKDFLLRNIDEMWDQISVGDL